jgi:hypothetical protein
MATRVGIGFQLSANAAGMAQGINAGVVELQKLGLAAKKTASDVTVLRNIEIGRLAITSIQAVSAAIGQANRLLAGFVDESVAIGEEASKANVIFGESAAAIQEFAQSASGIGLSTRAALQATASFGNLFTAIRLNTDQAAEYSLTLTRLATDLASFNNTSVEDAVQALGAALRGESEPIRRYGVLLSDALLGQVALANGFEVTAGALSPVVRAQAAYLAILQQTGNAQGDFERTSGSLANQQRILAAEWNNIRAVIGDALQPAYAAIVQALRDSLPAIRQAGNELAAFVAGIDFSAVISGAVASFKSLGGVFVIAANAAAPLARNLLPAIGGYLAFINRQILLSGISSMASVFAKAAFAVRFYGSAATAAAAGTQLLGASIRGLLASTGIGVLVVGLGLAAGAALEWALATRTAGDEAQSAVQPVDDELKKLETQFARVSAAARNFGSEVKAAVKIPDLSLGDIAQNAINSAQSAISGLARELGGTVNLPIELVSQFNSIQRLAERANGDLVNQRVLLGQLVQESNRFADSIKKVSEQRQADARAAEQAAEATRKAAEDARKRTQELAFDGLGPGEQSRIKLAQDLVAIDLERVAAEEALRAARSQNDRAAIAAAQQRLRLVGDAAQVARDQDRQRQLQALGIDNNLLRPAQTIADEFAKVREAFRRRLIDPDEAKNALRNLAAEGIKIRENLNAELARPAAQALEVQDIRSGGLGEFLRLATGREDPAIEQNRQQLTELARIRQGLERIGVQPVEILGS